MTITRDDVIADLQTLVAAHPNKANGYACVYIEPRSLSGDGEIVPSCVVGHLLDMRGLLDETWAEVGSIEPVNEFEMGVFEVAGFDEGAVKLLATVQDLADADGGWLDDEFTVVTDGDVPQTRRTWATCLRLALAQ